MPHKTPEARRAYHRQWRAKNHERIGERWRRWYVERGADFVKASSAAWRVAHPGAKANAHRKDRYRLSAAEYHALVLEQEGRCAICGEVPSGEGRMATLRVDHDHLTGFVRGLLCHRCNSGLGYFLDNVDRLGWAQDYLNQRRGLAYHLDHAERLDVPA